MTRLKRGFKSLRENGFLITGYMTLKELGFWDPVWNTVTSRYPLGTNVFEEDWDLLIILDDCRVDALESTSVSRPWLDEVDSIRSVGSATPEWTLNTFRENISGEIEQTAYISSKAWSSRLLDRRMFILENASENIGKRAFHQGLTNWNPVHKSVFGHYEVVRPLGNQADQLHPKYPSVPHILTDRAISVGRSDDFDRTIVHYNLPHAAYIADALDWVAGETDQETLMTGPDVTRELQPWEKHESMYSDDIDPAQTREAYLQNLRLGLDYVEILLQNFDAEKVVISSDHGEGLANDPVTGHPFGCPLSYIKTVPWATTRATDNKTYESKYDQLSVDPLSDEYEEASREFLKQMGYL